MAEALSDQPRGFELSGGGKGILALLPERLSTKNNASSLMMSPIFQEVEQL
jgi:hypothetical protein